MCFLKRKIIFSICLVLAISLAFGCIAMATSSPSDEKDALQRDTTQRSRVFNSPIHTDDAYTAPINPSDTPEEWAKLKSGLERMEATQIPAEILEKMSTAGLVNTFLNCHFFYGHIFSSTTLQDGFDATVEVYNGLQELLRREDSGTAILNLYKAIDLETLYLHDESPFLRLQSIEVLCSQSDILGTLTPEQGKEVIHECITKIMAIMNDKDFSETFAIGSTLLLAARCLNRFDATFADLVASSPTLQEYVRAGTLRSSDVSDATLESIYNYIIENYY